MSSVTIPGKLVQFLEHSANIAFAGTRDKDLVPHGHQVPGWRVGADGRTLTALVAEQFTAHLIESLEDNGQFALTVEEYPSHETYQFKGRYLRHRPLMREDIDFVDGIRDRFVKRVRSLYPAEAPEELVRAFIPKPGVAVDFEVSEIYVQTPGPRAGARLVPNPEART